MRFAALLCAVFLLAGSAPRERYLVVWAMEANEFPANCEGRDFLAVFDVGSDFGKLVAFVPTQTHAMMAHHTNEGMPPNHLLFGADFMANQGDVFDLSDPLRPQLVDSFGTAGGYTHMHSFASLSNGHTLATYQIKGTNGDEPGALAELDGHGRIVRASEASHVVQIWRLSDLKLLQTLDLPKPPVYEAAAQNADDATLLDDGTTVMVKTSHCGLFTLTNLTEVRAQIQYVYDFGARTCSGVPVVAGRYWVQAIMSAHTLVALDVKDPAHPTEVSQLYLGARALPHWLSLEPGTGSIVITGYGSLINRISFASIDRKTGSLTLDPRFIDLKHRTWADGWNGAVIPHGAVFY